MLKKRTVESAMPRRTYKYDGDVSDNKYARRKRERKWKEMKGKQGRKPPKPPTT
jgi:hypothetical protein